MAAPRSYRVWPHAPKTCGPAHFLICSSHGHAERVSTQSRIMSRPAASLCSRTRSKNSIQIGTLLRECASSSEVVYCRTSASEHMNRAKSPYARYDKFSRSHSASIGNVGMALRSSEMAVTNVKPMSLSQNDTQKPRSAVVNFGSGRVVANPSVA